MKFYITHRDMPRSQVVTMPHSLKFGDARVTDADKLQRHTDSAHRGVVDPNCPACIDIQRRYGLGAGK